LLHQWMQANVTQGISFFLSREWQHQQIEEDIMSALAGVDIHVLFFMDTRPIAVHRFMIEGANKAVARMPRVFSSLKLARNFWSLIMRRNYHFIKMSLVLGKSELSGGPWKYDDFNAPWGDSANLGPGGNIFSTPKEPVLELIPESVRYREDVRRWSQAAGPIFKSISESGTQEEKVLCALLQVHRIMNDIMLQSTFFTTETAYDHSLSEFRRMMFLINYVHPHVATVGATETPYHFDLGVIPPLYFAGIRCRDKAIRDNVIDVMNKVHYREGMWDTLAAVKFIEWMRELEDPGRDDNGFVPEHKRAFLTCAFVDLEGKRAILQGTQKTLNGRVFLEKMVSWG